MSQSFQIHGGHCTFTPESDGLFQCPCSHHKGSDKKYRRVIDLVHHLKTVQKILSSSITGGFTFLSPYLLETSAMAPYSLVVNTEYKLLICLSCKLAILPSQLKTHLSSQHSIRLPVRDQSPIADLLSIAQVHPSIIPELPSSVDEAIDGLSTTDGYLCPICSNICFTHESLKTHMRQKHKGDPYPSKTDTVSIQQIKKGIQNRMIRVEKKKEESVGRFTEDNILSQVERAIAASPAESLAPSDDPRNFCLWLRHIRWQDLIEGKDVAEMMALVAHPKPEEFPRLHESFLKLLQSGSPL